MTPPATVATQAGPLVYTEAGPTTGTAPTLVLLHGWPQDRRCWDALTDLAAPDCRTLAFDLPGIGNSTSARTSGMKHDIASVIHEALLRLGVNHAVIVGHDIGGMVAYDLHHHYEIATSCVLLDTVLPGIDPWDRVMAHPRLWHFAFHSTPGLPERMVQGRQGDYFAHFFTLTHPDQPISTARQQAYAQAYSSHAQLTAGFDWYRQLDADAEHNRSLLECSKPLLYLRGASGTSKTTTSLDGYVHGLREAGNTNVTAGLVADSVHYLAEENPTATWAMIKDFITTTGESAP